MADKFVTVARFNHPLEAEMAKGRLEAEGIECYLADQHAINIQPLYTNAIGGVRLQVPAEKEGLAREALREGLRVVPDLKVCPQCGGSSFAAAKRGPLANIISFLSLGVCMPTNRSPRHCKSCGHSWRG